MNGNNQTEKDARVNRSVNKRKKTKVNPKKMITAIVVIIFVGYFLYTMIWQQVLLTRKSREIDMLEEKISAAEQQKEKLEKELENLDSPEYLEKIAREKLGLVRPNERVFIDANQSDENHSN